MTSHSPASQSDDLSGASFVHLRVERPREGVALVVLDNPTQRNAMSDEMTASWVRAVEELERDRSIRAVVITGEGSAFSSGGNLGWLASEPDAGVDRLRDRMLPFYRAWLSIRRLEVPTIAAINGPAIGAGLCFAMACDLRFTTPTAKMGVPFTQLGLHPGMAGTFLLTEAVGPAVARDLFLTGRIVAGDEALRLGLVSRVLEGEDFREQALDAASQVAAAAPIATKLTKQALRDGGHGSFEHALQWEAMAQPITLATDDLQEGIRAAQQKRRPQFRGR